MPIKPDDTIRPRVWVALALPILAGALVVVYFAMGDRKPSRRAAPIPTAEAVDVPAPTAAPPPAAPQASSTPAATVSATGSTLVTLPSARTAAASSADAIREIDALLARPPDSGQWTAEQKNAYRSKLIDDLNGRERILEREIAAAHRSGDKATEQTKTATLDYARRSREVLESSLHGAPGAPPATDAGP
jgi:hypothetical protein